VSAPSEVAANKEFVKSIYDAFGRGDAAAVLASFDQEILWAYPDNVFYAEGSPFKGPNEVFNKVFVRLATEWENFKVEPTEYIAEGDRVVVLARETGIHRETGGAVDVDTAHIWTIRDGRAIEFFALTDTLALSRAAGLVQ
jgi:ketosteroid isomerase-like protein